MRIQNIRLFFVSSSLLLLTTSIAMAIDPYQWDANRTRVKLTQEEGALSELVLKQHVEYNYRFEGDQLVMDYILHRITLVNNSEAIQKNNRLKIPMNNTLELTDVRARTITKDGKVILFDKSNLKELKEEESDNAYKIFAIEGIEIGSEVEYYFVRKMQYAIFHNVALQMEVPVKNISFTLTCPKHLKFDFKSYWGFPEMQSATDETMNTYTVSAKDIPPLKEEPLSYFEANRKRIEFKLAYNTAKSQARLYTWDEAAKRFFTIIGTIEKSDEKPLQKYIESFQAAQNLPLEARIRSIERKVKRTIQLNEETSDKSLSSLNNILKYKITSKEGMTKLFYHLFTGLNIETHIVLTCNREYSKFDEKFDTWSYLDEYLLYLPQAKGFIAPYSQETIFPLVPYKFSATQGLFIEPIAIGGVNSGLGSIQPIPALPDNYTFDNLNIEVSFHENLEGNSVKQSRGFGGYSAAYITPYYHLMTEEQKKEMVEEFINQVAPDKIISHWKGTINENAITDEFNLDVNFESAHFIEKAGPKILFKAGLLIGPQMEMYRDDKRTCEVENQFNRRYDRTITINIPKGYSIKNAKDLKFDVAYLDGDVEKFVFRSDYAIDNNILRIKIEEFYKDIYAPVSRYEDFRKVINASADFNKVTLVLEKL